LAAPTHAGPFNVPGTVFRQHQIQSPFFRGNRIVASDWVVQDDDSRALYALRTYVDPRGVIAIRTGVSLVVAALNQQQADLRRVASPPGAAAPAFVVRMQPLTLGNANLFVKDARPRPDREEVSDEESRSDRDGN